MKPTVKSTPAVAGNPVEGSEACGGYCSSSVGDSEVGFVDSKLLGAALREVVTVVPSVGDSLMISVVPVVLKSVVPSVGDSLMISVGESVE